MVNEARFYLIAAPLTWCVIFLFFRIWQNPVWFALLMATVSVAFVLVWTSIFDGWFKPRGSRTVSSDEDFTGPEGQHGN